MSTAETARPYEISEALVRRVVLFDMGAEAEAQHKTVHGTEPVTIDGRLDDVLWLRCNEFDEGHDKFVNQNWTYWSLTGAPSDRHTFEPPGFQVMLSGAVAADVAEVCRVKRCHFRRSLGPLPARVCPTHGTPLQVHVFRLE